jgi:hypothetical protein
MLQQHPEITRTREFTSDHSCAGARFHSPTPLVVQRVTVNGNPLFLCGTCRDNMELLADLIEAEDKNLPWPVLREFGSGIRDLLRERMTDG